MKFRLFYDLLNENSGDEHQWAYDVNGLKNVRPFDVNRFMAPHFKIQAASLNNRQKIEQLLKRENIEYRPFGLVVTVNLDKNSAEGAALFDRLQKMTE